MKSCYSYICSGILLLTSLLPLQAPAGSIASAPKSSANNFQITSASHQVISTGSGCPQDPEAYHFTTQRQIDDFGLKYGGCSSVPYLNINGADITNLDGLHNIETVDPTADKSHDYFYAILIGNLSSVYDANPMLRTLSGLEHLRTVTGTIIISGNKTLTEIHAFQNLSEINNLYHPDNYISGLEIAHNPKLEQIDALSNLYEAGYIFIADNWHLKIINNYFDKIEQLYQLFIVDNIFTELTAFHHLAAVQTFYIEHSLLKSLEGFANLRLIQYSAKLGYDKNLSQCHQLSAIYKKNSSIFDLTMTNPGCLETLQK